MSALYDYLTERFRVSYGGYTYIFINPYSKLTAVLNRLPYLFSGSSNRTISLTHYSIKETAHHFSLTVSHLIFSTKCEFTYFICQNKQLLFYYRTLNLSVFCSHAVDDEGYYNLGCDSVFSDRSFEGAKQAACRALRLVSADRAFREIIQNDLELYF